MSLLTLDFVDPAPLRQLCRRPQPQPRHPAVPRSSSNTSLFSNHSSRNTNSSSVSHPSTPCRDRVIVLQQTDELREPFAVISSSLASVAGLGTSVTARFDDGQGGAGIGDPGRSHQQRVLRCSHARTIASTTISILQQLEVAIKKKPPVTSMRPANPQASTARNAHHIGSPHKV